MPLHVIADLSRHGQRAREGATGSRKESDDVTGKPPGLGQVISIGSHELLADEAREAGSNDEGPDLYEYLLASLGACTNMTLRMYANHKGWPRKQIETTLSHSKSYATECEHCKRPAAMIEHIERRVALFDDLSDEQRKRLLETANPLSCRPDPDFED